MALPLPAALLASLEHSQGFDRQAFCAVHELPEAITALRYNDNKLPYYTGKLPNTPIPWSPFGYYLDQRPSFTQDPLFHGGLYYVQEPGSQFIWEVLSQTMGRDASVKVLDLCAAPGGKSTLLASFFKNGLVVANEVIKNRAAVLVENVTKWGSGNIVVTNNDPQHFERLQGYFDVILVDAPCSGSGLFRKDNSAIEQWSEENVLLCSRRQQRILADVYPSLKEDGLLIYSTCSYSLQEDEEILDWLMAHFSLENIPIQLPPDSGITEVAAERSKAVGYKFYPNKVKSEGFFVAAFRKKDMVNALYNVGSSLPAASIAEMAVLKQWLHSDQDLNYIKQNNALIAIDNKWLADISILQKNLYLKKVGIELGEVKNKGLVPAHDLALSTIYHPALQKIHLDRAQSLIYLKKGELDEIEGRQGWTLAVFQGISLGWMKILPNRINNYYPSQWRILKD